MRPLFSTAVLLAGLMVPLPVLAAGDPVPEAPEFNDFIIRVESDVTYDGAYLMAGIRAFVEQLRAEYADDPEAIKGIDETYGWIQLLGLDHMGEMRQRTVVDETGFAEELTLQIDPAGAATPLGRWINLAGTSSTFVRELGDDEFLFATTIARPDEYLALAAEGMSTKGELLENVAGAPFGVKEAHDIMMEYMPSMQQMLAGAEAFHLVLWSADVMNLDVAASIVIEYRESAQPFTDFMAGYSEKRKLVWTAQEVDGHTLQVLPQDDKLPIALAMGTSGTVAVIATDPATAAMSLDSALVSTRIWLPPYVYKSRLNVEKLRQLIPGWAADLAMSQIAAEDAPPVDVGSVLAMPMGEITVERAATPNTMTIRMTADREIVHVFAVAYEQMLQSMARDMIRDEQKRRRRDRLYSAGDTLELALDDYYIRHEAYPDTLGLLLQGEHLTAFPNNPFTGAPMTDVPFDSRSAGNLTYVPILEGRTVTGYQLLIYGPEDDYADVVDNYVQTEDGRFIQTGDGYEDMVAIFLERPYVDEPFEDDTSWLYDEDGNLIEGADDITAEDL